MELFLDASMSIPVMQMVFFVSLISVFLLFGRQRLCIITTFLFTFYWGFILNKDFFIDQFGNREIFMTIYLMAGFFMLLMIIVSYFVKGE